jgi:gephyrin
MNNLNDKNMNNTSSTYVETYLPPEIVGKLQAGAFDSLVSHLQERSDAVQNIDLMTVSGFCRNCLAKWMVVEARKLSDELKTTTNDNNTQEIQQVCQALDALGYEEAAQYVYGCDYQDWKKAHAKKATEEQMQRYNDSKPNWATHDKDLLATRAEKPDAPSSSSRVKASNTNTQTTPTTTTTPSSLLLSNVCCQDVNDDAPTAVGEEQHPVHHTPGAAKQTRTRPVGALFQPPPPPKNGISFTLGILTVSDRAAKKEYASGDLSGPAVERAVLDAIQSLDQVSCTILKRAIVPDSIADIQKVLKDDWSNTAQNVDLIFTTGGTGFAPRDVTPEATAAILDYECRGLLSFVTTECSRQQPLASLSRGTCGILNKSIICNLPGNPKGVSEVIPILLPILLHAISDMHTE